MAYSAGLLRYWVTIAGRMAAQAGPMGIDGGGIVYSVLGTYRAGVTFNKGVKAMREGALDAYDVIIVRMRWTSAIDRNNILQYDGRWFQIKSFHRDYHENIVQITCEEMTSTPTVQS